MKKLRSADPADFKKIYVQYGDFSFYGSFNGKKTKEKRYRDIRLTLTSATVGWDGNYFHSWQVTHKNGSKRDQIGSFNVMFKNGIAMVSHSNLHDQFHGFGLGKMLYSTLAYMYKVIESDPNGNTSEEARRVWKALKSRKIANNRYRLSGKRSIPHKVMKKCRTRN